MYDHERTLVKDMSGRPFALLGVNNDDTIETVKDAIEDNKLNWRSWYDGPGGPIVDKFEIKGFPTIFLVDHEGVIRYKNLRGDKLDAALEYLVSTAEESGPNLREYMDVTGTFKTMATYQEFADGKVVLVKEDETEIQVPWNKLCLADQQFVAEKRLQKSGYEKAAAAAELMLFDEPKTFSDKDGDTVILGTYIALKSGEAIFWNADDGEEETIAWSKLHPDTKEIVIGEIARLKK